MTNWTWENHLFRSVAHWQKCDPKDQYAYWRQTAICRPKLIWRISYLLGTVPLYRPIRLY